MIATILNHEDKLQWQFPSMLCLLLNFLSRKDTSSSDVSSSWPSLLDEAHGAGGSLSLSLFLRCTFRSSIHTGLGRAPIAITREEDVDIQSHPKIVFVQGSALAASRVAFRNSIKTREPRWSRHRRMICVFFIRSKKWDIVKKKSALRPLFAGESRDLILMSISNRWRRLRWFDDFAESDVRDDEPSRKDKLEW